MRLSLPGRADAFRFYCQAASNGLIVAGMTSGRRETSMITSIVKADG